MENGQEEEQVKPRPTTTTTTTAAARSIQSSTSHHHPPHKALSIIVLGASATYFEWSIQFVFITPTLLRLGTSPELASFAWMFAPGIFLFLGPWVGRRSDLCTSSMGKRRPFLMITAALISVCLVILPLSAEFLASYRVTVIVVFILINCVLDISTNLHTPLIRALATDLVSKHTQQAQTRMQSWTASSAGFGNILGTAIASIDYSPISGRFASGTIVFFIAATQFAIASATMIAVAEEEISETDSPEETEAVRSLSLRDLLVGGDIEATSTSDSPNQIFPVSGKDSPDYSANGNADSKSMGGSTIWAVLRRSHASFTAMVVLQLITNIGMWSVWMYTTTFFAHEVFEGDHTAEMDSKEGKLYSDGIRRGALALFAVAWGMMLGGALLPLAIERLGLCLTFCSAQIVTGVCVTLVYFIHHEWLSVFLIGASGIAISSNLSVPYIYLSLCVPYEDVGVASSAISIFSTVPLFIVGATFGSLVHWTGDSFATPFLAAGVAFLVTGVLGCFIPFPPLSQQGKAKDDLIRSSYQIGALPMGFVRRVQPRSNMAGLPMTLATMETTGTALGRSSVTAEKDMF